MQEARNTPFKRAKAMFMTILNVRQALQNTLPELQVALSAMPAYRSRGKGRAKPFTKTILGKWGAQRSKYAPHQGKQECARRRRQRLASAIWVRSDVDQFLADDRSAELK